MSKFTDFPRNTKQVHIRHCAQQLKERARIEAEIEAAHKEYAPTQVFNAGAMVEADDTAWGIASANELGIDLTNYFVAA